MFPSSRPIPELAFALSMLLGPGGCGASPEGEASEDALLHCPTGGDPQPPVYVGRGLTSSTTSTTPTELEVCLNQNIDRLVLYSQVQSSDGRPVTSCITHELSRVGRHPVDWAMGTLRTFPLGYPEVLPPGEYSELVYAVVAVSPYHVSHLVEVSGRFFEVDASGLAPSTSEAYSSASIAGGNAAVEREPCVWRPGSSEPPNDERPADDTITRVNLGDWSDVATVQPLRHEVNAREAPGTGTSVLTFGAWTADGGHIELALPYRPEAGTAFESRMASVHIQDAARVDWHSLAGHVVVTDREEGELEVTLLDLVFERGRTIDEPRITRVMSGTISGVVRRECYGPSRESADPSWSPDDCAEVRRAGGF